MAIDDGYNYHMPSLCWSKRHLQGFDPASHFCSWFETQQVLSDPLVCDKDRLQTTLATET